tara:strand:+ start:662 stop:940 length:279 start_codon:yes stop_codon:yes gene_type:complete
MFLKAELKKSWKSKRGKLYPPGTKFVFSKWLPEIDSALYDFYIPRDSYGIVVIPNSEFRQLTPEQREVRESRRKAYEEHMKNYKDRFIITSD